MTISSADSIASPPAQNAATRDPLAPVLSLGDRNVRFGVVLGLVGALLLHGAVGAKAASVLGDMADFALLTQANMRERLHPVELDLKDPPEPPPAEKEPEPEPDKEPPPPVQKVAPEVAAPPPAAAEAGKVLTAEPDPNEPVDLTGDSIVTGNSDRFAGGVTTADGTSKTAVRDVRAQPDGVGKGAPGPIATVVTGPDLSRPAAPTGGSWNDCEFPAEADIEGVDSAVVQLTVTVGPNGRAKSVTILRDPGNGFGQSARSCAFRKPFNAALDRAGAAITMSTAPFTVRFTR